MAPWFLVRDTIAQRWRVPPWVVDIAPHDEVDAVLRLMNAEAEAHDRPSPPSFVGPKR